jgi:hypothetical protein
MADLPQYSWGYDPATGYWGYTLNKAGDKSAEIGRAAGYTQRSYKAPPEDAAAIQAAALQHLIGTQTGPGGAATPTTPTSEDGKPLKSSGIAAAIDNGGSRGVSGEDSNPAWSGLSDADKAAYYAANPTMAGITQMGQKVLGYTGLGMLANKFAPENAARQAAIAQGIDPDNPQTQGTAGGGYGAMGGGGYGISVGGDGVAPDVSMGSNPNGYMGSMNNPSAYTAAPSFDAAAEAAANAQADSARAAAAAAAEGAAYDAHDAAMGGGYTGGDYSGGYSGGNAGATNSESHGGDDGGQGFAKGGMPAAGLHAATRGTEPRFVRGAGDGQSDDIPVKMDDGGDGRLADNEFVVPADAVSALGSGSSEAGARALYDMVDRIRKQAHGNTKQANPVDPGKVLPA